MQTQYIELPRNAAQHDLSTVLQTLNSNNLFASFNWCSEVELFIILPNFTLILLV